MAPSKYVYFFGSGKADGRTDMKDLLGGCGHAFRQEIPDAPTLLTARLHFRPDTLQVFGTHHALGTMTHLPPQYPMRQGTYAFTGRR